MNRLEKRGKVTIIDNRQVIKTEDDYSELEKYLASRDFNYFIPTINRSEGKNYYDYLEDYSLNKDQKAQDITKILALLHNKTSFIKEVTSDSYTAIYENILGYIVYVDDYYKTTLKRIEYIDFPSPSETLFLNNYTKIIEAINFDRQEIDKWYGIVKGKTKQRVCLNHGNIDISHAINNDRTYLISWGNNRFDSPILDLITFYQNEWENIEFETIFETYFEKCELSDEEKKLLFINISIPPIYDLRDDELENIIVVRKIFDYLFKTEKLIGPYYTIKNEK